MANTPTPTNTGARGGAKTGRTKGAKPKLVPSGDAPALAVVGEGEAAEGKGGSGLRLKELVDRVVAATGGKKKDVKGLVEATLLQMGAALQKGESLNLPTFGKVRIARQSKEEGGAMTLKLRQGGGGGGGKGKGKAEKEALAEAEDQD